MNIRFVFALLLITIFALPVFAEEPILRFQSVAQESENGEYIPIIKNGIKIGEIRPQFIKNEKGKEIFRIRIILNKKEFPVASNFKEIGAIACKIYDIAQQGDEKYTVHLRNHDAPELSTYIEVQSDRANIKDNRPRQYIINEILNLFK